MSEINLSNREALEDAKRNLAAVEAEIKEHEREISRLNSEKAKIIKGMSILMDTSTEEKLLSAVYEQRKKLRS
ncbi:MAG: hypothetical protein II745_06930 [Lachnospiraceae bacterium]|nr:hypothetical protein [Lachnospiraceae bacterium]